MEKIIFVRCFSEITRNYCKCC